MSAPDTASASTASSHSENIEHTENLIKKGDAHANSSNEMALHSPSCTDVDADHAETELANAEMAFLYAPQQQVHAPASDDELGALPSALERLGDAYVSRVYGLRADNLRRALLSFRYALRSLNAGSRHAVRLCAKLSSVLARSALNDRNKRPAPPAYDPASVVALTHVLPLPPHARSLPPPLVAVRDSDPSSPHGSLSEPVDVVITQHDMVIDGVDNDDDEEYDSFDSYAGSADDSHKKSSNSVVSKVIVPIIHGWPSVDCRSGPVALTQGEFTAAALCTGEYALSMYADSPNWCEHGQDALAYLNMRTLHGVLYDKLHQRSTNTLQSQVPVVRGARGTPPSEIHQRSNTLLALCLNALEPVLTDSYPKSRHRQSSKPIYTTFAHVPSQTLAPNVAGLRAVIATETRLTLSATPAGADEPASSMIQEGATTALKIALGQSVKIPDVDRVRALVSLCRSYVRMQHEGGDAALIRARDTLVLVVSALPKLREHWSTHIACKNVACTPFILLLDDLADDAASLAAAVRTPTSPSFSRCAVC